MSPPLPRSHLASPDVHLPFASSLAGPAVKLSMTFITGTSPVLGGSAADAGGPGSLSLLGYVRDEHALYFLEHEGGRGQARLQRMFTRGAHAGRTVAVRDGAGEILGGAALAARLAELEREHAPLRRLASEDWTLATRVV